MAKKANGVAKSPMSAQQNGSIAPSAASHTAVSTTTTTKSTRSSRRRPHKRSYSGWLVDKGAKLLIWYTLITVLFRCPSSQGDLYESSPKVCKGYLRARDYLTPYTQPYYNQHLAPYIQQAQPYFDHFNAQVYTPGHALYQQHAAPRVAQAQKLGYQQWDKTVKPQLDVARHHASKQYEAALSPYVNKAYESVNPHYQSLKTSASDIWELELQPVYRRTAPYTQKLFTQGRQFAVDTALPQAQYASSAAWSFWIRQIWPKIRVLYGENVEPQLMRITERLGRYRDEKKVEAEVKSMEKSSSIVDASSTASSSASSVSSAASEAAKGPSSASSVAAEPSASVDPRELFLKDLKSWEQVCAKAVDEGTEHLKERVDEIASHQQKRQVEGVGKSLVTQLEDTVEGVINSSKARILAIVGGIPEEATDDDIEEAQIALATAIRSAGQNVKARAQAIREWHQAYTTETTDLIDKALESTLETVDSIRELRLAEIGRKYSDSGLAHKDWSKYNDLKKATKAWRKDVEQVAVKHDSIASSKNAAQSVEQQGMSIAEEAAKELARLKDVGKWKIAAEDSSDNFDTKTTPAVSKRAQRKIEQSVAAAAQAASEAALGSSSIQDNVKSATAAAAHKASNIASGASEAVLGSSTGSAESVASKASEAIIGSEQPAVESVTSKVAESVSSASSVASSAVIGTESSLTDSLTDAASSASEAIIGSETPAYESMASSVSSKVYAESSGSLGPKAASIIAAGRSSKDVAGSSASSAASEGAFSASSVASEASYYASDIVDDASSTVSSAASAASETVSSKVWGGAMAQAVPASSGPIMDEEFDDEVDATGSYSERVQAMVDNALDQGARLTQAIEEAIKPATSTQGNVESVTSVASAQYESAMSAASSILYGAEPEGTAAVKEQYLAAVAAASQAIYGTPSPVGYASSASSVAASIAAQAAHTSESVAIAAASRYQEASAQAQSHYDAAKSRIYDQMGGTAKPVHREMFQSAKSAYSDAVSAASERYGSAAESLPTIAPVFEKVEDAYASISAIAASRLSEGLSAASAQYQNAKIAVGAEPTPASQAYLASAQQAYYQGIGYAHDQYSSFVGAASSAVGATPTPAWQAYVAAAQSTYDAAIIAASSQMQVLYASATSAAGVTSTSPAQSVLDSISSQYDAVFSAASSQLAAATGSYKKPAYQSYIDAASASYSSAVAAASVNLESLTNKARSAAGATSESPVQSVMQEAQSQYEAAIAAASSQMMYASTYAHDAIYGTTPAAYDQAASAVSTAIYGTETPFIQSVSSRAEENWLSLIALASDQVYGQPPPFTDAVYSTATSVYAQATDGAIYQYEAVQSLFSELIMEREPEFTESVMARLQSAYYTGAPQVASAASSYAEEAYQSASSVVSSVFTPPPTIEAVLESVQQQLESALDAASAQVYGTSKGKSCNEDTNTT
jgi:hypothetical protein